MTEGIVLPNQILGHLGRWHHQKSENERQNSKIISQEN